MELANTNIKVITNGGEITSIKYKDIEILYQGNQSWKKSFPVVFPVAGFSDGFEVNGINYKIAKHGFWKDLKWDSFLENENLVLAATHIADAKYPFSIDLQQFISLNDDGIQIETQISNLSAEEAYFHFGYHPAFNIDEKTKFITNSKKLPLVIDLDGKIQEKYNLSKELMIEPFGESFDTLVYKDVDVNSCYYQYKDLQIKVKHDANNLQIWKPSKDSFICIEPWYASGDRESDLIKEAKNKKDINILNSGKTWKATMSIEIKKIG